MSLQWIYNFMDLNPNRIGKATEYKRGHNYLTIVEWEDGHCEIEIHQCIPELLFHSCDKNDLDKAKTRFICLSETEATKVVDMMDARKLLISDIHVFR